MDTAVINLDQLKVELRAVLNENILGYWLRHSLDEKHGGFIGHINSDNSKEYRANKNIILNTRLLWTFSHAYRQNQNQEYLDLANRAYQYIFQYFRDEEHGGVYWELDYSGKALKMYKHIYAQAFVIYSLTEYYMATKRKEALSWAIEIFKLIEKYSRDTKRGGYIEAFRNDWSGLDDFRLSEKDPNEKKTMNTHLHLMEAYTNLIRISPDASVKEAQISLVNLFFDKFLDDAYHLKLFFNEHWNLKSDIVSFGHDIEAAWLLCEATNVLGDIDLQDKAKNAALKITDTCIEEGMDKDGGIINERSGNSGELDTNRHWWQQAEAMVALMNAWQISGNDKYLISLNKLWKFIKKNIIDHEQGEWYWKVDQDGNPFPEDEKAGAWKCSYHNSRACIELINRIEKHR